MPRGGRRIGAGRKPKAKVVGMDGKPRADVLPPSMQVPPPVPPIMAASQLVAAPPLPLSEHLQEPPADIVTEEQQKMWREWAPKAIAQGTLTDLTSPGFAELIRRAALQNHLYREWALSPGSETTLKKLQKNNPHVDRLLTQFKLTGAGKPEVAQKKKPAPAAAGWAGFGSPIAK